MKSTVVDESLSSIQQLFCSWEDQLDTKSGSTLQTAHSATEKSQSKAYPLQMMEILEQTFDKIAIDLVTESKTFSPSNKHILIIIDCLTGWPEVFPIPYKSADTIVSTFINQYLPVHMYPKYILSDNVMEFKNLTFWTKYWNS